MAIELITQPADSQLAILDHRIPFDAYSTAAQEHLAFWKAQKDQAADAMDLAKHGLVSELHQMLGMAIMANPNVWPGWPNSPFLYERNRRAAFGVLATSMLLRRLIPPGSNLEGGLLNGTSPIFDAGDGAGLLPTQYGIHVAPEVAEVLLPPQQSSTEWFRLPGMYVERISPAQPTKDITDQLPHVNFSGLVTLRAYAAA